MGEKIADSKTWQSWLDEYAWRLLAHAKLLTRSQQDAEDLTQEAVIEFWSKPPHTPPDLPLVLHRIRQRAIDLGRKIDTTKTREEKWQTDPAIQIDQIHHPSSFNNETHLLVQQALQKLDPIFREVVSLKLWSNLTFDQIGTTLQIPKSTAASRYRIALEKLQPILTPSMK